VVVVEFLGPIGEVPLELEIGNLKELSEILKKDEKYAKWLENSAVAINDNIIKNIDTPLKDGDRITILPPVCGG